jgi:hypothetical protein
VRPVKRQDAGLTRIANIPGVAETEEHQWPCSSDRSSGNRRASDARIGLPVVIAVEALEVASEPRPLVRREQGPVVRQPRSSVTSIAWYLCTGSSNEARGTPRTRQWVCCCSDSSVCTRRSTSRQVQVVRRHRKVRDVLEHAPEVAIGISDANGRVRRNLPLRAELIVRGIRQLRVGIDRVGAGPASTKWLTMAAPVPDRWLRRPRESVA